jgi:hypothetical protein
MAGLRELGSRSFESQVLQPCSKELYELTVRKRMSKVVQLVETLTTPLRHEYFFHGRSELDLLRIVVGTYCVGRMNLWNHHQSRLLLFQSCGRQRHLCGSFNTFVQLSQLFLVYPADKFVDLVSNDLISRVDRVKCFIAHFVVFVTDLFGDTFVAGLNESRPIISIIWPSSSRHSVR